MTVSWPDAWPYLLAAGAVFLALLILGLVVLLPLLTGGEKRRRLAEVERYRLKLSRTRRGGNREDVPGGPVARTALAVTEQMVRTGGWEERFAAQLDRAGMTLRAHEWVLVRILVVLGSSAVLAFLLGPLAIPFGVLFGWLATAAYHRARARRRAEKFTAALPAALQLVIGSLRSGFSLVQALEAMAREVGDPIATEVSRALAETRLGMDLDEALERLAERTHNRDLAWAVMAIRIQREVGGNLAEVLETTVATIRERDLLRSQVRSLSAEGRLSAVVLVALPLVVGGVMFATRRDYIGLLFTDPRGVVLLLVGAALLCVGAFWLSRVVRVEV